MSDNGEQFVEVNDITFNVIAMFTDGKMNEKKYVALMPSLEDENGEKNIVLFRYEDDGDNLALYSLDNAEFRNASELFDQYMRENG